jgi:hypothetical protein
MHVLFFGMNCTRGYVLVGTILLKKIQSEFVESTPGNGWLSWLKQIILL